MDAASASPSADRLDSLDLLRGIAVLGILLMNIVGFGLPLAYSDPTVAGGSTGANLWAWLLQVLFFEGTMRGLFTLLFGAGVVLFTSRAERSRPGEAADLHVRRMLWLVAFGFVNSHLLLWTGDILYEYGLVGLVLYAFRKARPRTLLVIAALILAGLMLRGGLEYQGLHTLRAEAASIRTAEQRGATLDDAQRETLEEWDEAWAQLSPPAEKIDATVAAMRGGFASAWTQVTGEILHYRTKFFYEYGAPEDLATMLLGVALFGYGALQGAWSRRQYLQLMLAGYGVGLTVNGFEAWWTLHHDWDPIETQFGWLVTYELGRVPTTLGHVGLVLLAWKSGWLQGAARRLAATGRMAFTNYLTQSVICTLLFTGVGFGLYGRLERHELYYVVAGIWLLQLAWSPWWLARFQQGPLEWLWRTLTYRERQPFRRAAPQAGIARG
jgi:uncharacterized protein